MKIKNFVILTGCLLFASTVKADIILTGDYTALFGTSGVSYVAPETATYEKVLDKENELIGYASTTFTGFYLGTIEGNDQQTLINYLTAFLGTSPSLDYLLKVDQPGVTATNGSVTLNLTYTNLYSGSWAVLSTDPTVQPTVSFYTVKGGPNYALYFVDPAAASGTWTTENITKGNGALYPAISHLSVAANSNPIPEPATMLLFGTGIAGLAAVARRRKN